MIGTPAGTPAGGSGILASAVITTTGISAGPSDVAIARGTHVSSVAFVADGISTHAIQLSFDAPLPTPYGISIQFFGINSDYQIGSGFPVQGGALATSITFRLSDGSYVDPSSQAFQITVLIS
jgi:hypothetical protein